MIHRCTLAVLVLAVAPVAMARNPSRGWFVGADAGVSELDGEIRYWPVDFVGNLTSVTLGVRYKF